MRRVLEIANPQKIRELAFIAPLVGALFLMPPVIWLFSKDVRVFGMPIIMLYVFGVWVALIVIALLLAKKLSKPE